MPRFYFHAHCSNHSVPDHEGIELDDAQTARAAALIATVEALDDMDDLSGLLDRAFKITNEAGQTILTIPLSECALAWGLRRKTTYAPRRKQLPLRNYGTSN